MICRIFFFALIGVSVGTVDPTEDNEWLYEFAESLLDDEPVVPMPPSRAISEEQVIVTLLKADFTSAPSSFLNSLTAAVPGTDWDESRVDLFVKHVEFPLTIPHGLYKTIMNMHAAGFSQKEILSALLAKAGTFAPRFCSKAAMERIVSVWTEFGMSENVLEITLGEVFYSLTEANRNAYLDSVSRAVEEGSYLWLSAIGKRKANHVAFLSQKRSKKSESTTKQPKGRKSLRTMVLDKLIHQKSVSTIAWTREFQEVDPDITVEQVDAIRSEILEWTVVPMEFHDILASSPSPVDLTDSVLLASLEGALPAGHPVPVIELARVWIQYCVEPLKVWKENVQFRGYSPCYAHQQGTQMRLSAAKSALMFREMIRREAVREIQNH